ncbi:MAG: porin family protein [Bacteroidales bacterium]|jgi:hypothetical protein|nr:porin family protein [Bacteroidales bacterium]
MKKFFVALMAICTVGITLSHAQKMEKDMSLVNIGLGFLPGVGVNVSYDYGLVDKWGPGVFTIGGFVGFSNWGRNISGMGDYRQTRWAISPRATYRYAINPDFEVYGAVMTGLYFNTYSKYRDNSTGLFWGTTAGCRYSFMKNMSVFAEIGYNDVAALNGGISISF